MLDVLLSLENPYQEHITHISDNLVVWRFEEGNRSMRLERSSRWHFIQGFYLKSGKVSLKLIRVTMHGIQVYLDDAARPKLSGKRC